MKMCHSYFKGRTPTKCDIPFRTDSQVEDDYASASQCSPSDLLKLERQHGAPFRSLHGEVQHVATQSRPDIAYAAHRNGMFQSFQCALAFQEMDRIYRCLHHHPLKPLVFPKQPMPSNGNPLTAPRILRAIWSKNDVDEYEFSSGLEAWPDAGHAREKALRCSHGGVIHTILGTSIAWKVFKLAVPLHSTDAEVRVCLLAVKRTKQHRLFLEHLGIPCPDPTPLHEDNSAVISPVKANKITSRMRHVDIPLCCMHNEYNLQTFDIGHCPSKIMITNFLTKPLSAPSLARETAFAMGHMHLQTIGEDHFNRLTSRNSVSTTSHYVPTFKDNVS